MFDGTCLPHQRIDTHRSLTSPRAYRTIGAKIRSCGTYTNTALADHPVATRVSTDTTVLRGVDILASSAAKLLTWRTITNPLLTKSPAWASDPTSSTMRGAVLDFYAVFVA